MHKKNSPNISTPPLLRNKLLFRRIEYSPHRPHLLPDFCRRVHPASRIADRSVNGVILSGQIRRTAVPLETARHLTSCS